MSTRLIGGGHLWFGVRSRAIAFRAILIVTSTEGALLPTALLALVAIGTALLKAWSPATLATFSLGYRQGPSADGQGGKSHERRWQGRCHR